MSSGFALTKNKFQVSYITSSKYIQREMEANFKTNNKETELVCKFVPEEHEGRGRGFV